MYNDLLSEIHPRILCKGPVTEMKVTISFFFEKAHVQREREVPSVGVGCVHVTFFFTVLKIW